MPALSLEDVLDLEYPGPPVWSDTGEYLAATVYEDDGKALQFATADGRPQWRYRPDGSHVRAFTWRPDRDECLVATDDGRTIIVDATDESERPLSTADEREHVWSNGGDRIACYRDGTPWIINVATGESTKLDVPERGPYLAEERMFAWSDDDSLLAYRFVDSDSKQIGVIDVETGDLRYRTDDPASSHSPTWLEDGSLLFVRVSEHATRRELVVVDPCEAGESVLVEETESELEVVSQGIPEVSPHGDRFAVALPLDGWDHLYVVDEDSTTQVTNGAFEDKGVADSAPVWLDERTLVFSSNRIAPEQRGIYAVDTETETVRPIVETEGTNVHPAPSPDGDRLAYVHADAERSPEIRVCDIGADPLAPGFRTTRSVVDDWPVDPVPPERVVLETTDSFGVPAFVIDPRDTDAVPSDATDLPAVVWAHGGPMRQMRDGWHSGRAYGLAYAVHQYLAQSGYVGLLINYRGGIGYGKDFRQAISADPGKEIDVDVVAGAEYLSGLDHVNSDAIALWGLSYGGYAVLRALGTAPDAYDLGINLAGIADWISFEEWATETKYPAAESSWPVLFGGSRWEATESWDEASPVRYMGDYESPLYNFHGTADEYVNFDQLDIVVTKLLEYDADFEYEYYPGETHLFSKRRVWERVLEHIETALETELG